MIGSVLYEAMKADIGLYADAIDTFVHELQQTGSSDNYLGSLFG